MRHPEPLHERLAYVRLLERTATAANTCETLEAAAEVALDEVCSFSGWPLGHLYLKVGPEPGTMDPTGVWHTDDPARFAGFQRLTEATRLSPGVGLAGRILATGRAAWITDLQSDPNFPRAGAAADAGLRSAFAFPVAVGSEVAAVLEFFAAEPSEPDTSLLDLMAGVGTQLGRVVERQRASSALRQSEQRFRALTQSTAEAIITADARGTVVSWNAGASLMFGYEEADVVGRPLTVLMPARHRDAHRAGLSRYVETGAGKFIGRTAQLEGLRADGTEFPVELSLSAWSSDDGPLFAGIIRDITDRRRAEDERREFERRLAEGALRDHLTGLPNRVLLLDRLELALARAGREGASVAVLFIDLDRFKAVNESVGHQAGDELLRAVADRMRRLVRPGDTVARVGGDEFAVLFEDLRTRDEATELSAGLLSAFDREFDLAPRPLEVTASAGVTIAAGGAPEGDPAPGLLLSEAELALNRAREGDGGPQVYDDVMRAEAALRQATEQDLRLAIGGDQFVVHYQPIIALGSGALFGVEALIRWQHPLRGLLLPDEFVPAAEETGLIVPLGTWVLVEACHQAVKWQRRGQGRPSVTLSVNVSTHQFQQASWPEAVARALADADMAPEQLILEITESSLMENTEVAALRLAELRRLGVRLAIDDFGTGYSSLGYLRHLPVDILKIDKSFIDGITEGPHESALARAVLKLARTLGLEAVAEGIERHEQLVILQRLGCQLGQGFYLGRPQSADAITDLLR